MVGAQYAFAEWLKMSYCLLGAQLYLFVTPWTIACQAPLSMDFSRQECWSVKPFSSPAFLPNPGIEPKSSTLAGRVFTV